MLQPQLSTALFVVLLAQPSDSGENALIRAVLEQQVESWNRGDLAGFMSTYWKSDNLTFSSGKDVTKGWQPTFNRYRKRYQSEGKEMGHLTFSDIQIELLGPGSAYVRGRWKLKQSKETVEGLYTLILKKLPEGWRIVHDHTSG